MGYAFNTTNDYWSADSTLRWIKAVSNVIDTQEDREILCAYIDLAPFTDEGLDFYSAAEAARMLERIYPRLPKDDTDELDSRGRCKQMIEALKKAKETKTNFKMT
jgi:hypothetical protein